MVINLDDLRDGDKVTVEATVTLDPDDPGTIKLSRSGYLRFWTHIENEDFKVLSHTPKPIEEPKGLGAAVRARGRFTGRVHTFVRVSNTALQEWFVGGATVSWDALTTTFEITEVLNEGVQD